MNIYENVSKRLNLLKGFKFKINRDTLAKLYKSVIRPLMEYADVVWDGCSESVSDLLESVQYESAKVVTGAMRGTGRQRLLEELAWEDLKTRRSIHKLVLFFKIVNNLTYLTYLLLRHNKDQGYCLDPPITLAYSIVALRGLSHYYME